MLSEESRVVIVTGVARGLGAAMAVGLAQSGCRVVGVFRPREGTPKASDLPAPPDRFLRVDADVTVEFDCQKVIDAARERFGSVDVLINNAAIAHADFPKVHETELKDIPPRIWRRIFDVNVNGPFLMTQAAAPHMVERGWGRVINISSSTTGMLTKSYLPYGPSKAALEAMSHNWAEKLSGTGVTVNELLPGGPTGLPDPPATSWPEGLNKYSPEMMLPPLRWLVSSSSDGVTGRRFVARLWDTSLDLSAAVARSGFPLGWPSGPHEVIIRPPQSRT
jgi:NAD(P)-dependent dehydrogenase (short-subunit alcohol dehydrogenase family)